MATKSAAEAFRKALAAKLKAMGYPITDGAKPRPCIRLFDVTEGNSIDKGDDVREIGFQIDAISERDYAEAATIIEAIEDALIGCDTVTPVGWTVLEIYRELGSEIHAVEEGDLHTITRRTQFRANVSRNTNQSNI